MRAEAEAGFEPVSASDELLPLTVNGCDCVDFSEQDFDFLDTATTVAFGDAQNSIYGISLENHVGNTWTYRVQEISGKSLSHWALGIDSCLAHVVGTAPSGASIGVDGSTGFTGVKWDLLDSFTNSTFSITMDADYPMGMVQVLFKAGPNWHTGYIPGPVCGGGAAGDCVAHWVDWDGGSATNGELVANLLDPTLSGTWSIGDSVPLGPDIQNSAALRSALDTWLDRAGTILLYDDVNGSGEPVICGFGQLTLHSYDLNTIPMSLRAEFEPAIVRSVATDANAADHGVRDVRLLK